MKKGTRIDLSKIVLATIKMAGLLAVAAVAPNSLQLMKVLGYEGGAGNRKYSLNRSINRLKERGLIKVVNDRSGTCFELTEKGHRRLLLLGGLKESKPKKWDGKWRMVIFDIREKRKTTRDAVRRFLYSVGFYRLQDSVWVYPHDCEEFISILKVHFKIGRDLLYVIAENIEKESNLKQHFGLVDI